MTSPSPAATSGEKATEPLPCPFCGLAPYIHNRPRETAYIRCTYRGQKCVLPSCSGDTLSAAISKWNTRSGSDALAELEAVRAKQATNRASIEAVSSALKSWLKIGARPGVQTIRESIKVLDDIALAAVPSSTAAEGEGAK